MGTIASLSRLSSAVASAAAADSVRHDDSRLSDSRTPITHSHPESDVTSLVTDLVATEKTVNKGASNGYAPLVSGVVPHSYYQYATTTTDGSIVLAGDLAGTAPAPTVPGLALKAPLASPTFTGIVTAALLVLPPVALTYAATVTTDVSTGNHFRVTLTGALTLANPTSPTDGQRITWELIQDATGSRTISFGTKFAFGTDIPSVTLTTTASKRDFLSVIYNSTADKFYIVSFIRGY